MNVTKLSRFETERISDFGFRTMSVALSVAHLFSPPGRRVAKLGLLPGMTAVDFGCGPGHFVVPVARVLGPDGLLVAVDVQELALAAAARRADRAGLQNVQTALSEDYAVALPDHTADVVFSLDVIHMVPQPDRYFAEMRRITKQNGRLMIDAGHLSMAEARERIHHSGCWKVEKEDGRLFTCVPV